MDWAARAQTAVAAVPRDLLARTAALLLRKESKSSYAIEGERPAQDRMQRWGRAIGEAGLHPRSLIRQRLGVSIIHGLVEVSRVNALGERTVVFVQAYLRYEADDGSSPRHAAP